MHEVVGAKKRVSDVHLPDGLFDFGVCHRPVVRSLARIAGREFDDVIHASTDSRFCRVDLLRNLSITVSRYQKHALAPGRRCRNGIWPVEIAQHYIDAHAEQR